MDGIPATKLRGSLPDRSRPQSWWSRALVQTSGSLYMSFALSADSIVQSSAIPMPATLQP